MFDMHALAMDITTLDPDVPEIPFGGGALHVDQEDYLELYQCWDEWHQHRDNPDSTDRYLEKFYSVISKIMNEKSEGQDYWCWAPAPQQD